MNTLAQNWPRRGARAALNLLFPPLCFKCRAQVSDTASLCATCWTTFAFLDGRVCDCCGVPFEVDPGSESLCGPCHAKPPAFTRARSVMRYDDASKHPILALKRGDRLDIAPAFTRWLQRTGRSMIAESDVIVPVPLYRWRLWARRFNQAAVLGKALGHATGTPFEPLALIRTRPTPSQGDMPSAKARRRNVRGAFRVEASRAAAIKGRAVLLIDDVLTTGATADACARALKRAGAAKVLVLTLARVARPGTI
ncbi:MAG TPA: ComF family protein [Rhizomicrobium sp.]|jgi:ComF family protein|nr:ComF family protein [Rhizomicrobium sp.]